MEITSEGQDWKVIVDPGVVVEQEYPMESSRPGTPPFVVGIGYDPRPPAGHKMGYTLYPKNIWTRKELETDEQIRKMTLRCNVCNALDVAKRNMAANPTPSAARPQPTNARSAAQPQPTARSQPNTTEQITPSAEPVRLSAGNVLTPTYLPLIAGVAKGLFCTKLGDVAASVLMSVAADVMSGWSSDPGQKEAMRQMSDGFATLDLCPDDMTQLRHDAQALYDGWKEDGMGAAVKRSMFKSVDEALKDGVGIDVKKTNTSHFRASFRGGVADLVD